MLVINSRFLSQETTGVQRYATEISVCLKRLDPSIRFVSPKNIIQKDIADRLGVEVVGRHTGHLWEQTELALFLRKQANPLLLNLCNTAPILYGNKLTVLHDVAYVRFGHGFSKKFRLAYGIMIPWILRTSRKVLTVSQFSRSEISSVYGIPENRIGVVYNAAVPFSENSSYVDKPRKYILSVSSLNARKNFDGLIRAFPLVKSNDCQLLIVGGFNRAFAEPGLLAMIDANPRVHFLGRVSDSELADLYRGATAFVFPSFYEGFGLPLLEAQSCGCPVLCSAASSFPEVCGDSALYFSPHDPADMAEKIDALLSDNVLRDRLIEAGKQNIKRFDWDRSAEEMLSIIRKLQS